MSIGTRLDPYRGYNFLVQILPGKKSQGAGGGSPGAMSLADVASGGFAEVGGLEMTLEVEEYKEGGRNDRVRKFPTRVTWGPLTLKRGVASSDALWEWHYGFVLGKGERRDGIVTLRDEAHRPVRVWRFLRGLPTRWAGPTLNARSSDVAIEELEITHEGLTLEESKSLLSPAGLVDLGAEIVSDVQGGIFDS